MFTCLQLQQFLKVGELCLAALGRRDRSRGKLLCKPVSGDIETFESGLHTLLV